MRTLFLLPLIFLAGCATTREVRVPVPVPCETEEVAEPEYPKASPGADIYDRVKVVLAENELLKGFVVELKAANAACRGVK